MQEIKQGNTTINLVFKMVLDSDGYSAATGLNPTVVISKNGGAFAGPIGLVTEIGNGYYQVAADAGDASTLGLLVLYATDATTRPTDMAYNVVANVEADTFGRLGAPVTASVSSDIALNASDIASLAADVSTVTGNLAVVDGNVDTLLVNLAATDGKVDTLTTNLAVVDGNVDTLLVNLATTDGKVDTLQVTVSKLDDTLEDDGGTFRFTANALEQSATNTLTVDAILSAAVPGAYLDGSLGAAIGRLNNTPADSPVIITPDPSDDAQIATVFVYTEDITGQKIEGVQLEITFESSLSEANGALVLGADRVTMRTDSEGLAQISLVRTDSMTPATGRYRVKCKRLGLDATFALAAASFDISSLAA